MSIYDEIGMSAKLDAFKELEEYLDELLVEYYGPYRDAGLRSLETLESEYNQLVSSPGSVYADIGSGFESSPGYQYQYDSAMNAQNSAMAAAGMTGTPYHMETSAQVATDLANQDYYNYMNDMMSMYSQGMSGLSGLNQMGYQASDTMANTMIDYYYSMARAKYGKELAEAMMTTKLAAAAMGSSSGSGGGMSTDDMLKAGASAGVTYYTGVPVSF